MLEYLRNMSDKIIAKILISLLVFSFIGWGVAEWILGITINEKELVRVGSDKITITDFNNEKSRTLMRLSKEEQKNIYSSDIQNKIFISNILQKMISDKLLEQRAKKIGISVSEKKIASETLKYPDFQEKGKFSPILFDTILYHTGFTEDSFKNYLEKEMIRANLLNPFLFISNIPLFMLKTIYNSRHQKKEIEYTKINFDDFKITKPSDEKLKEFYDKNPILTEETRDIEYILVPFNKNKPDEIDIAYKKIINIEDNIIGSDENLHNIAKKHDAQYIKINNITKNNKKIESDLLDIFFNSKEDETLDIFESKKGYIIGKVNKIKKSEKTDFNKIKSDVLKKYEDSEKTKLAYMKANEILTKKEKLKNRVNVSRTKGAENSILQASFNNKEKTTSIVKGENSFYVMHVNRTINTNPSDKELKKLNEEVKNIFKKEILADYNSFLLRTYKVKFNEKALNKLMNNKI